MPRQFPAPDDSVASFTRPDGTTEPHDYDHGRMIGLWENVEAWGAKGDGVADDTAAFQACLNSLSATGAGIALGFGKTYKVSNLVGPALTSDGSIAGRRQLHIHGNGATLYSTTGDVILETPTPANNSAASSQSGTRWIVDGVNFKGNSTAGQVGLRLMALYGSEVRNCTFSNLDIGLDLIFAIATRIDGCFYQGNVTYDLFIRSATFGTGAPFWPDAGNDFTASNVVQSFNGRHYCSTGQTAAVKIGGASGWQFYGEIFEGGTPVAVLDFDDNLSGNADSGMMQNCWFEYGSGATTALKMRTQHSGFIFRNCNFDLTGAGPHKVIDASGSYNNQAFTFDHCAMALSSTLQIKGIVNNTWFRFLGCGPEDIFGSTAYWAGGTLSGGATRVQLGQIGSATNPEWTGDLVIKHGGNGFNVVFTDTSGTYGGTIGSLQGLQLNGSPKNGQLMGISMNAPSGQYETVFEYDLNSVRKWTLYPTGAITTMTAAGAPTDQSASGISGGSTALDGMLYVDSTNSRLYVRVGGVWKYVALT